MNDGIPLAAPLTVARGWRHGRVAFGLAWRAAPGHVTGLMIWAVLAGLAPVTVAWLLKLVLDGLAAGEAGVVAVWLALALATLGAVVAVLPRIVAFAEAELNRAAKLVVFGEVFATVNQRLRGLARLEDPRFHDRLRLATSAGATAPGEVVRNCVGFGQGAITLIGFLATLVVTNHWLALVVATVAIPTVRAELRLSRRWVGAMWRLEHADRRRLFYSDLLSGPHEAKEIRLFGLGSYFRSRMLSELRKANGTERALERRELVVQAMLGLVGAAVAGGGLLWAIQAARNGQLTVGDVTVFVAAVAGVQSGLSDMIGTFRQLHRSLLTLDHYHAVVTVETDLPVPAAARNAPSLRQGIEMCNVWFRYGPDRPWILRGVDLQIAAGDSTALVGLNGAGKSTIVKLLCRLYDPTSGTITWDGIDLRVLEPGSLRERIAAVFQDYVQYELSAAENIGLGDLAFIDDRIRTIAAAERAGIASVLAELPAGYDTLLTRMYMTNADRDDPDTGVLLSGGQGQRLALARTFFRDRRDLLILDEPSAGLDPEAEAAFHQEIGDYRSDQTSLLISHRLNTVRDADRIAVLADGRITEYGNHATLMASNGVYARLFRLQRRGYDGPVGVPL